MFTRENPTGKKENMNIFSVFFVVFSRVAQLAEHLASIPKVVGSIPTVAKHIFQACPRCGYTLRVTSQAKENMFLNLSRKFAF